MDLKVVQLRNERVKIVFKRRTYIGRPMIMDDFGKATDGYEFVRRIKEEDFAPEYKDIPRKMQRLLDRVWREYVRERDIQAQPNAAEGNSGAAKSFEIKRTKFGTRIFSNDDKHYFDIGVWKSTKYPGYTSIRLFVAGKRVLFTVSPKYMKALRLEVSRGQPT